MLQVNSFIINFNIYYTFNIKKSLHHLFLFTFRLQPINYKTMSLPFVLISK